MHSNKNIIIKACSINEQQYGEMIMHYANCWIERYFGKDEQMNYAFNHSANFWKWWTAAWDKRDIEFIRTTGINNFNDFDKSENEVIGSLYADHHNADEIIVMPNLDVIKEVNGLMLAEKEKIRILKSSKK